MQEALLCSHKGVGLAAQDGEVSPEGGSSEVSWTRGRRERPDDGRDHGRLLALEDPGSLEAGPPGPRVGLDMALGRDNKRAAMVFVLSHTSREGAGVGME